MRRPPVLTPAVALGLTLMSSSFAAEFDLGLLPLAWYEDGRHGCFSGAVGSDGFADVAPSGRLSLSLMVYFKNEGHVLFEWVMHHLNAGVDHIYLIDNDSTDDFRKQHAHWLAHLTKLGRVTLIRYKGTQRDAYNHHSQELRARSKWLGVVDMDEFIYSPAGSLSELLDAQFDYRIVREIRVHWALFGINGNFLQRDSLIAGNVMSTAGTRRDLSSPGWGFKTIVSSHFDCHFLVHFHLSPCSVFGADDKPQIRKKSSGYSPFQSYRNGSFCRTDRLVPAGFQSAAFVQMEPRDGLIRINHYRYQSWERLIGIKERRGGGLRSDKYLNADQQYAKIAPTLDTPDLTLRAASAGLIGWLRCLLKRGRLSAGRPSPLLTQRSRWPVLFETLRNHTTEHSAPASETVEPDLALLREVEAVLDSTRLGQRRIHKGLQKADKANKIRGRLVQP